ncbi:MAG: hypothetical protein JF606_25785 [Burkholderiales bacterium]|nr:hypothetical protein [Burkholderiales bacterium]
MPWIEQHTKDVGQMNNKKTTSRPKANGTYFGLPALGNARKWLKAKGGG